MILRGWDLLQAAQLLSAVFYPVAAGALSLSGGVRVLESPTLGSVVAETKVEGASAERAGSAAVLQSGLTTSHSSPRPDLALWGACAPER